jgi:hypothetical protein
MRSGAAATVRYPYVVWPLLLLVAGLGAMIYSAVTRGMEQTVDAPVAGEPMTQGEKSWLGLVVRSASTTVTALVLVALWGLSMAGHPRLALVLALIGGFVLSYYSRAPTNR